MRELLLLLRRSRWMMRHWEMMMMMVMVMTMKSGLSKNLIGDRNEVVEARLKARDKKPPPHFIQCADI